MIFNRFILLSFLVIFSFKDLSSQSLKKNFSKLSSPEKCWVIFHPFKAKKAFFISKEAERISDSIQKTSLLDNDKNGGQIDAFRHAFWMATLAQEIGKRSAKKLGKAHEKGNYKQFKKNKLEEGIHPDKPSSEMDLFNNNVGIRIYKENKKASQKEIIFLIIKNIQQGNLKTLKKDAYGSYEDCNGAPINLNDYKGIWETPKCLIKSNTNKHNGNECR